MKQKRLQMLKNSTTFLIGLGFVLSPISPLLAQETPTVVPEEQDAAITDDSGDSVSGTEPEPIVEETPPVAETEPEVVPEMPEEPSEPETVAPSEWVEPEVVEEPIQEETATTTEELLPTGTKFKKNPNLTPEEQLAAVREHLLREGLPQVAVERLDAFKGKHTVEKPEEGIFKKVWNFITGNTEKALEKEEAEVASKKQPFAVEAFDDGEGLNTADINAYERDFSDLREQGSLIQKVKNFISEGTFFNSNFDGTKEKGGILSWLFGPSRAMADASNDPNDYLAEGNEIQFSQAIQDKADELENDPLKILNYVRNAVEYVPYYGSKKGADSTLVEFAGNDMDQASLLIAMLRHSDIPARYRQADIKIDIETVNGMLGTESATTSAQILDIERIPYMLYTQNGEPVFFVIEHTYVEAYLPYGETRGADLNDGGNEQWVAMDPSVNTIYYEQIAGDVLGDMIDNGFDIETFFDNYLAGDYGTTSPVAAFSGEILDYIDGETTDNEYLIFAMSRVQKILPTTELKFIPATLPYEISADLNTYDYVPSSMRHTITFALDNENNTEVLNHTVYLSDIANSEILITYDAATPADQTIIDGFDTIYDVVPLSIVAVTPKLKVNGSVIAAGSATSTLGQKHKYEFEFSVPTRDIGDSITPEIVETIDKTILTGNTDALALDTDRVVPPEFRPFEDIETTSAVSNQKLHKTAQNYLYRLENTQLELSRLTGGTYTDTATRAIVFNGIEVNYATSTDPYSFDWTGVRIDASANVRYYHHFAPTTSYHREEFARVFGLQASQDEADIFEDDFGVESVSTVKGLKMVSEGEFGSGITLHKITEANENDIDSLNISPSTKTIFHEAVSDGNVIYTPTGPVEYGEWEGLFYINLNPVTGAAGYIIGEGLNGGHSVCGVVSGIRCVWDSNYVNLLQKYVNSVQGTIESPLMSFVDNTTPVEFTVRCEGWVGGEPVVWREKVLIAPGVAQSFGGQYVLRSKCDASISVVVQVTWGDVGALAFGFTPVLPGIWEGINAYVQGTFTNAEISTAEKMFTSGSILIGLSGGGNTKVIKAMFGLQRGTAGYLYKLEGSKIKVADPSRVGGHIFPHTIKRHVKITKAQLLERAEGSSRDPATAFYGKSEAEALAKAEKYISQTTNANLAAIKSWAQDPNSAYSKTFTHTFSSFGEKFGHGYRAGGDPNSYLDNIRTVQVRFHKLEGGNYVFETGYPLYPKL